MLKLRKNKKGFTLVELIVVVAIMAVLAGTVAGVVVSTQNKTKNSSANSSAKGIAKAIAEMLNTDMSATTTEYVDSVSGAKVIWKDSGLVITDVSKSYDSDSIVTTLPKAGTNKYQVLFVADDTTGGKFTVSYDQLGSKGTKTFTVSYDSNSSQFKYSEN